MLSVRHVGDAAFMQLQKPRCAGKVRPSASSGHAIHTILWVQGAQARSRAPWAMTFDLRERDTEWTEENKVRRARCLRVLHWVFQLDFGLV